MRGEVPFRRNERTNHKNAIARLQFQAVEKIRAKDSVVSRELFRQLQNKLTCSACKSQTNKITWSSFIKDIQFTQNGSITIR